MKSYFSRFLYNTLSHFGIREVFTSSLSLSDLIGESRSNQVANLSHLDYRVKPDNDNIGVDHRVKFENDREGANASLKPNGDGLCAGRSMVEMLGVLAIIGVLSVGAIAGYSKAMFKYKLNKQAEGFNSLLNSAIQLQPDLDRTVKAGGRFNAEFFYKLGLVPDSMTYKNGVIYDVFNNYVEITYYSATQPDTGVTYTEYIMQYNLEHSGTSATARGVEICRNIVSTTKANAADLKFLQMRAGKNEGGYDVPYGRVMGDKECRQGTKCLRNMSVKDMDDFCSSCTSETNCSLMIYIYSVNT